MLNKIIELGIISQIAKVSNGIDWILENDDYGCHLQDLCVITSRQIFSCLSQKEFYHRIIALYFSSFLPLA